MLKIKTLKISGVTLKEPTQIYANLSIQIEGKFAYVKLNCFPSKEDLNNNNSKSLLDIRTDYKIDIEKAEGNFLEFVYNAIEEKLKKYDFITSVKVEL